MFEICFKIKDKQFFKVNIRTWVNKETEDSEIEDNRNDDKFLLFDERWNVFLFERYFFSYKTS